MAFRSRLLSYTCSDAYSFRNGYPLSTYIETLIITVEACGVLLLVAHFQRRLDAAFAGALPALPLRSPDIDPSPKRKPLVRACCVHSQPRNHTPCDRGHRAVSKDPVIALYHHAVPFTPATPAGACWSRSQRSLEERAGVQHVPRCS